jgi:hypothetical protein
MSGSKDDNLDDERRETTRTHSASFSPQADRVARCPGDGSERTAMKPVQRLPSRVNVQDLKRFLPAVEMTTTPTSRLCGFAKNYPNSYFANFAFFAAIPTVFNLLGAIDYSYIPTGFATSYRPKLSTGRLIQ